ncbi:MAG TPA: TonB-dependent receptor [Candidatus Limnocylindrales bacterium]|nr:TonB-dependent receptor [Candidatus Limnocylindrales bacterium]
MRKSLSHHVLCAAAIIAAISGTSPKLWAQFTSSIEGTVIDPTGAAIPKAKVLVTNSATGVRTTIETNNLGYFLFPSLPAGSFNVNVTAPGFKATEIANVGIELDQRRTLSIKLDVGTESTSVTVQAEAATVDLSGVRLAGTLDTKQLTQLPTSNQAYMTLVTLMAGMTGGGASDTFNAEQQVGMSANGQRGEQNGFAVDSGTVTSMVRHGRTNMQPNIESIDEMQVTVNNFSAETASDAGVNVNVLTKGGTNQYHGSAAWYNQIDQFQSRTIFQVTPSPATGRILSPSRRNEPMGSFGGPVKKNKIFLFASFDVLHRLTANNNLSTVETPEFSSFVQQNYPNNKSAYLLKNYPEVMTPYRDFRTVGTMPDDQGINRTGLIQLAGTTNSFANCSTPPTPSSLVNTVLGPLPCNMRVEGNGLSPISTTTDAYQWSTRGDYQISDKDRFYATVYRTVEKAFSGSTTRPAFSYIYPTFNWFGNVNETHTFTPAVLNEFRITVTRVHGELQCRECDIPSGINTGASGFAGFGLGNPVPFIQNNYEYKDNISINHGAHSIRAGVQFSFLQSNWKPTASYTRPNFTFATIADFVQDNVQTEGNIGLNPKDGSPYTPDVAERQHTQGWFLQDTWKVKPNLTVTYGVRWEYYGMVNQATEGNNVQWRGGDNLWTRLANGANFTKYHILDHGDKNNYAPRLAIAWDPTGKGKTSIRTGFGIFYDFLPSQLYGGAHFTPPLFVIISATPTNGITPLYAFGNPASKNNYNGSGVPYQFPYPASIVNALGLDSKNGSVFSPANIVWIDPSLRNSYTPSWNFGIQHVVTPSMSIELNYVGNAGRKLYAKYNMNRYPGDLVQPDNYGKISYINSSFGQINYGQGNLNSSYEGFNATLRKRLSHRTEFQVAYTMGHAISVADSFDFNPIDAWNTKLDRGSTGTPQRLASSFIYEVGSLSMLPKYVKAVTDGWQLSGVFVANSAGYFNVSCGGTLPTFNATTKVLNNNCDYNLDNNANERALVPSFGNHIDLSRQNLLVNGVFKASDFPTPTPGSLTGEMSKDFFRGFGNWNLDLAVARNFRVPFVFHEKAIFQLRGEAFNAPNRVNLGGISTSLTSASFGKVTSASNARLFAVSGRLSF